MQPRALSPRLSRSAPRRRFADAFRPTLQPLEDRCLPSATLQQFTIPAGDHPIDILGGPDGALWYTTVETSTNNAIRRFNTDGTVQIFTVPNGTSPIGLGVGPFGAIWFSDTNSSNRGFIGSVTPNGQFTETLLPGGISADDVTGGPDGNLWFTGNTGTDLNGNPIGPLIGRFTPSGPSLPGGQFSLFSLPGDQSFVPDAITTGPDGNIWFTADTFDVNGEAIQGEIGRITPNGTITMFGPLSGAANEITRGPDGNIWFTEKDANLIGKITLTGTITEYTVPTASAGPNGIAAGPDGNIWFAETTGQAVNDISPMGVFGTPISAGEFTSSMTSGPGGFPWVAIAGPISESGKLGEVVIPGVPLQWHLIVTGPDQGGGPDVRVYDAYSHVLLRQFLAYNAAFTGGVRVAVGDVNNDGYPDIITAAGPGGGPHVEVWSGKDGSLLQSFMAYNPAFAGGIYVAAGDVNHDGFADIITGAGAGGGPHVEVWSGKDHTLLYSFMAYDPAFSGGVRVAGGDVNGDGYADIVTGAGPGGGPHVEVWSGKDLSLLRSYMAFPASYTGGVFVAAGDLSGSGKAELIVSLGGASMTNVPQVEVFSPTGALSAYNPFSNGSLHGTTGQMLIPNGIHVGFVADTEGDGGGEILVAQASGPPAANALDPLGGDSLDTLFAYNPGFLGGVFIGGI